ncbi:MAG TPA: hypothetical protein VN905_02865 [Candidatus Binatia bacterium]|nr:hypothetical protein [Candidatus Binatia bacterium]
MRALALLLVAALALSVAAPAAAQRRGGGGARAGGARPAPAARPASRPAPATRPAPSGGGGGFNLNRDVAASRPTGGNVGNRPGGDRANIGGGDRTNIGGGDRTNIGSGNRTNIGSGNTINRGNRTVVANPVYPGAPAWGWNRGVAWYPSSYYWGGGFWGSLAIGVTSAAVFGAIVNTENNEKVESREVDPNSPGATFLSNYQLRQVECGPPNLVVVWGPENSVICAAPNHLVSAGEYDLDTAQLTLVTRAAT